MTWLARRILAGTRRPIARAFSATSSPVSSPSADAAEPVDVCIVGGGIVGTALACSIRANPLTAHLTVSLADRAPPPASAWLDDPPPTPEPRVSALTPASVALLRDVGAWDRVEASRRACAFRAMQVWDAEAVGHVRYDASEVGATELGHVVENRVVHTALHEAARRLGVQTSPPAAAVALDLPADGGGDLATIKFRREGRDGDGDGDGTPEIEEVRARLVVGADGPSSKVRTLAGLRAAGWRYGLKAAVGTVATDEPHGTAWQRFLPTGPLALLPVTEDGRVSNVVWTTTPEEADRLCGLCDEAFAAEVDAALRGEGRHSHGGQGEVGTGEGKRRRPGFVYGFEGQWLMGEAQERLVEVKREHTEERAAGAAVHSELRASVDAKVQAAVKEALAQVADALECACCLERLAPGAAVALECGHTYCNRAACASSSVKECPECRRPIGARVCIRRHSPWRPWPPHLRDRTGLSGCTTSSRSSS